MIVYAPSFAGFVHALKYEKYDIIEVITNNPSIVNFCLKNNIKHINYGFVKPKRFFEIKYQKKFFDKMSENIKKKQILFCFYGFDVLGLYFLHQLRKNNNVFFYNKDYNFETLKSHRLILKKKELIDFLVYFFILKIRFDPFIKTEENIFFGISPDRLKKTFKSLDFEFNERIFNYNKTHFKSKLNIPNNAIIFIDQGNSFFDIDNSVIEYLENKFDSEKVFIKPHPNHSISNSGLLKFKEIPKYIPLELIINYEMTLVGICSTVLVDSHVFKKISLINQVHWNFKKTYKFYNSLMLSTENIEII